MVHGVLLVNKKKDCTSHDVVQAVRKILKQKQVGHAGTLDPMAEGLMVILLGYGTKLSPWLLTNDKSYHFIFRLGVETDTLDKTGQVLKKKKVLIKAGAPQKDELAQKPSLVPSHIQSVSGSEPGMYLEKATVQKVVESVCGECVLPVPAFSAVKLKGQKMYEYQRKGQSVALPLRTMFFYNIDIKAIHLETVEVALSCKKGSYVRAWVSDIGDKLGTGACLESLTRLQSAPFDLSYALSLEDLKQRLSGSLKVQPDSLLTLLKPAFVPFSQTLPHIPSVEFLTGDEQALKHGKLSIEIKYSLQERQKEVNKARKKLLLRAMNRGGTKMLALIQLSPFKSPHIERVFPTMIQR